MVRSIQEVLGDHFMIAGTDSEVPTITAIPIGEGETQIVTFTRFTLDPLACESVGSDLWLAVRAYACGLRDQRHVAG